MGTCGLVGFNGKPLKGLFYRYERKTTLGVTFDTICSQEVNKGTIKKDFYSRENRTGS